MRRDPLGAESLGIGPAEVDLRVAGDDRDDQGEQVSPRCVPVLVVVADTGLDRDGGKAADVLGTGVAAIAGMPANPVQWQALDSSQVIDGEMERHIGRSTSASQKVGFLLRECAWLPVPGLVDGDVKQSRTEQRSGEIGIGRRNHLPGDLECHGVASWWWWSRCGRRLC